MGRWMVLSLLIAWAPARAAAEEYVVAEGGDDGAAGTVGAPWATLQHAADTVGPGDTVTVMPGSYRGFQLETSGTVDAPITFTAMAGVTIDQDNPSTPDGINLEGASFVVIEGFTVNGRGRAGIRAVLCERVTIRRNSADRNDRWGILTGFCNDLLIEDNECSRSVVEHGIYVSNSADRPVVRRNRLFGNNANGLHMNGDASLGGDGVISDALVEENVVWDNGTGGGSGINCDGCRDALIRNNMIFDNHASGISLYVIDGASSADNTVINNTVVQASDGRWALNIQESTGNQIFNNILLSRHAFRGAIDVSADSLAGMSSDYNVVIGRFTADGGDSVLSLAEWRVATGHDAMSVEAGIDEVFEDPAGGDYHLSATSPALDVGRADGSPSGDYEGDPRPVGDGVDIGADERCEGAACAPAPDGGPGVDGGPGTDGGPGVDGGARPDAGDGGVDGGCGCRSAGGGPTSGWWALVALVGMLRRRATGLLRSRPASPSVS